MRGGRLLVRAAAVAALLIAAVVAFVVITQIGGERAHSSSSQAVATGAKARPSTTKHAAKRIAHVTTSRARAAKKATVTKTQAKPVTRTSSRPVAKTQAKAVTKLNVAAIPAPHTTPVAVLNGGTARGAAAALAARLRALGYPVPIVGNAGRHDLPMAIEYSKGLGPAAQALARHVGRVQYVTPLEGPNRNLSGARLLVILGR
jgi:hypothetical protein